jgi:hypothetical protein
VAAAREAAPRSPARDPSLRSHLTIISGGSMKPHVEAVSVYEAVALRAPGTPHSGEPVSVVVRQTSRPVVLVLSSHQAVHWKITVAPDATLSAVLLSGYGKSTVSGAGKALVTSIGGFYAFKRGSAEFKHLETEVRRCTGRNIEGFQSQYAGHSFVIG